VDDARRNIVQLRISGELDGMRLSKADFAERWGVPRSTAWSWLQRFKSEGLIYSVATGMRNVTGNIQLLLYSVFRIGYATNARMIVDLPRKRTPPAAKTAAGYRGLRPV
jgi:hypothetical protein